MNKYQLTALKCFNPQRVLYTKEPKEIKGSRVEINDEGMTITQGEDLSINECLIATKDNFENLKMSFYVNKKWVAPSNFFDNDRVSALFVLFDFKNPIKTGKIESMDGTIDTFEFPIKVIYGDVDAYNKRVAEAKAKEDAEQQAKINELIKSDYKIGENLVNLYWDIVNDKVKRVKVELYLADGFDFNKSQVNKEVVDETTGKKVNKWVTETKIIKTGEYRKVASYEIEPDITFKSVPGLAYGTYAYEITELDSKGQMVATTGKTLFKIIRHI